MAERTESQLFDDQQLSDLVRDARLTTTDRAGEVVHTIYSSTPEQPRPVLVEQSWKREKMLGLGSFGVVWLEKCTNMALGKAKSQRAVKEITKDKGALPMLRQYTDELETIFKFSHERYRAWFTRSYGWWETPSAIFIAMEFASFGNLGDHLNRPFGETVACGICKQVLDGLSWMHENQFVHRDLKPQNILVFQKAPTWWVKLSDFGISKRLHEHTAFRTTVGTLAYMAPEIRGIYAPSDDSSDDDEEHTYTFAIDMWSLGQLTSQMITGGLLFQDGRQLNGYVVRGKPFPLRYFQDYGTSELCCEFIEKVMSRSPSHRMTAEQALKHSWIEAKGNQLTYQDPVSNISKQIETDLTFSSIASGTWDSIVSRVSDISQQIETDSTLRSVASVVQDTITPRYVGLNETATDLPKANQQWLFHQIQQLRPLDKMIIYVAFSRDGLQLVTASYSRVLFNQRRYGWARGWAIDLWETNGQTNFQRVQTLENDVSNVNCVAFSPNGQWVITRREVHTLTFWRADHHRRFSRITSTGYNIGKGKRIVFSPNSQLFVTLSEDQICIFKLVSQRDWQIVQTLSWDQVFDLLAFSPNGQLLASRGFGLDSICIWKSDDQGMFQRLQKIAMREWDIFLNSNLLRFQSDKRIISNRDPNSIWIFEMNKAGEFEDIHKLGVNFGPDTTSIFCLPNSKGIISASWNETVSIWEANDRGRLKKVQMLKGPNYILDLSPGGEWLVTGTKNASTPEVCFDVIIWKRQTEE